MDTPILADKTQFPTEELIFSHLGKSKNLWLSLFEHIHKQHPDITEEWRYYNDGKSWLMKMTRKKKTVFWLSVIPGSFRTTFYFTEKASEMIQGSKLSEGLKEQFRTGKSFGKIRGISVTYKFKRDVEDAKTLIVLKLSTK